MDAKIADEPIAVECAENDDFLLEEGLEVLANYRSIGSDSARFAVRQLIAALAMETLLN